MRFALFSPVPLVLKGPELLNLELFSLALSMRPEISFLQT